LHFLDGVPFALFEEKAKDEGPIRKSTREECAEQSEGRKLGATSMLPLINELVFRGV
jgi:hypothetical protein